MAKQDPNLKALLLWKITSNPRSIASFNATFVEPAVNVNKRELSVFITRPILNQL